ncbi:ABC transporter substrate-binding protein [Isoptericola nanjingensis]|uniref:ABC transporter substrate-binding protein n=1 Tax=Isoptericola nanjingensis TaxID=903413 RepID=UPI003D2619F8
MRAVRKLAGGAVAALLLVSTAACGSGDGASSEPGTAESLDPAKDVTITFAWWGDDDRASKYEEAIDLFEEKHPNVTVQTQFQAWDDYWTARNTEAAGGALPDVMQMDLSYLRQYGNTGQLLDLTGQIGVNLDTDGLEPSLLEAGLVEGGQIGIPTSVNTLANFYNKDLLDDLGVEPLPEGYTWDEFDAWIEEVSKAGAGKEPVVYGGSDYWVNFWFFLQYLLTQGQEPFTDDGQLNFDQADLTDWLNRGQPYRDAGDVLFPIQRSNQLAPVTGFTNGEVAVETTWDNFLAQYEAELGDSAVEMLPLPSGENGPQQFWKPGMLLSASSQSEEPAAAAALIDFLINEPEVGKIFGTSKGVPAVQAQIDAMDVEPGSVDEQVLQYEKDVAELVTATAPLPVEGFGEIEVEFRRLGEELQYGNITVDEFVTQWFSYAEGVIPQP